MSINSLQKATPMPLRRALEKAQGSFYALFPKACAGCDGVSASPAEGFCSVCRPAVHRVIAPCCACCQLPMDAFEPDPSHQSLCSRCVRTTPAFDGVHALWEYDGAVSDAICRVKYGGDLQALRALCREARPWFLARCATYDETTPIFALPSHLKEVRRRGFHVPGLTLRYLRGHHSCKTERGLKKIRPTTAQASLSFAQRHENVADVFHWRKPAVCGGTALLFDDVMTTGATANSAAQTLKAAGFDSVFVLVLARARLTF